ncbi:MAG: hypothetical protein KA768_01855 [Desulfobulbus sp.]|uniref:hypothetical protein n=1 Tax=uncultured Desulfobulbus sp. TaxID=239745 RepID=UPI001B43DB81|nr:hypothetical protein [uncultured Desulfobulbus sp.]MBP7516553.1 hypothetical protein [Desulfobulbus sp.]
MKPFVHLAVQFAQHEQAGRTERASFLGQVNLAEISGPLQPVPPFAPEGAVLFESVEKVFGRLVLIGIRLLVKGGTCPGHRLGTQNLPHAGKPEPSGHQQNGPQEPMKGALESGGRRYLHEA